MDVARDGGHLSALRKLKEDLNHESPRKKFVVNYLARATMFRRFGRPILIELAETTAYRSFSKNTTVIYQGDTPSSIYVIVRGKCSDLAFHYANGRVVYFFGFRSRRCIRSQQFVRRAG